MRSNRIVATGVVSLAAFAMLRVLAPEDVSRSEVTVRAARIMEKAMSVVRSHYPAAAFDLSLDPNKTGLIGPEYSPLMTTLGQLEAKRTSTNPNMAGLVAGQLELAGVRAGDTVAIGSSGSFPAFLAASLAAARALDAHAVCILSLGASSYGATDVKFDLLDIYAVLQESGICGGPPAAVSLGGEKDVGLDLEPEVRERLTEKIRRAGLHFIHEPDLEKNVAERIAIYRREAKGRISAFINSGGGYANLGTSPQVLKLSPGLNIQPATPPLRQRGVLYEMAALGMPVIHLLYVRGLTQKFGLPWDPIPLPPAGNVNRRESRYSGPTFWVICFAYFGLISYLIGPWS